MGAIQNGGCLECPLHPYRPFKSNVHKAAYGKEVATITPGQREEAARLKVEISKAQERVLAKALKFCPKQIGFFRKAFGGESYMNALKAHALYLANYEKRMVED